MCQKNVKKKFKSPKKSPKHNSKYFTFCSSIQLDVVHFSKNIFSKNSKNSNCFFEKFRKKIDIFF
jgi:hypothetical protein